VPSDRDNFLADENPPSAPTLIQVAFAVEQMRAIAQVRASVHAIWQNDRTDVDQKAKHGFVTVWENLRAIGGENQKTVRSGRQRENLGWRFIKPLQPTKMFCFQRFLMSGDDNLKPIALPLGRLCRLFDQNQVCEPLALQPSSSTAFELPPS
jgi:hypothetical protein